MSKLEEIARAIEVATERVAYIQGFQYGTADKPRYVVRNVLEKPGSQTLFETHDEREFRAALGSIKSAFVARAALDALRVPSEEMLSMGRLQIEDCSEHEGP